MIPEEQMLAITEAQGMQRESVLKELRAVSAHPYYKAAEVLAQRLRKLESLLAIRHELAGLDTSPRIERRDCLSREEFLRSFYAANRPIILTALMSDWLTGEKWTPAFFKSEFGTETVEIMSGRESDPSYESNSHNHKRVIQFSEYVDMVEGAGVTNDFYLVANNHLFAKPGMRRLLADITLFPEYLKQTPGKGEVFLWYGPAGTVTPLHHDTMNIFMAQVRGRKRIKLVSPDQSHLVYNNVSVYSDVDCDSPDLAKHPLFRAVDMQEVVLEPGEVLFLPVGWWHHVRALDVSITVTFTNFQLPNRYNWNQPHIRG